VAVILAAGGPATALAAKAATSTLPIVVAFGSDPVKLGLVASLNRPGGNVTGVTFITTELRGKRLDILCALVPQAVTTAYLSVPDTPTSEEGKRDMIAAARALGREIVVLEVRSHHDLEAAFGTLVQRRVGALVVGAFPMFTNNREKLLALAAHHKIPTIYPNRSYTSEGGLVSYGADLVDAFRQGGVYAGRILKGAKPADLPVQQPTRFELAINLKTAKALGLTVPDTLLVSADEVIE
jgi:putative ABC transport system substrate-binding protein